MYSHVLTRETDNFSTLHVAEETVHLQLFNHRYLIKDSLLPFGTKSFLYMMARKKMKTVNKYAQNIRKGPFIQSKYQYIHCLKGNQS